MSYPKPSTLFSIGLETKKKRKNDFKRLHNKRKARNEPRDFYEAIVDSAFGLINYTS